MVNYFPKYITNRAIGVYLTLLLIIPLAFRYPMHWYWMLFGLVEVVSFFYFSYTISKRWLWLSGKRFEQTLLYTSFFIRLVYVLFSFGFYYLMTGTPFEFSAADVRWYDDMGRYGSELIWHKSDGSWQDFFSWADLSDTGYPVYLSIIYAITGNSILIVRVVKALLSAFTVVLMMRLSTRNFGEKVGHITGVMCMLMPNLIYYCGLHLKETEMLFLTVLFVERADAIFRAKLPKLNNILFLFLIGIVAFFFRAVLCYVLFLTLVASAALGSNKIKKGGKWAIEGLLLVMLGTIGYFQIGSGPMDASEYEDIREQQAANMQWRSERKSGNSYAKYASASVFAPLIFTIPFPTMVNIEHQQNQQMIHGGNYVKNITSFFTILAMILLLFSGEWRDNIVPLSFMMGYLIVLAFSSFAQSERFHIPSLPFELMFASYAISKFKAKYKGWLTLWLLFVFVANIGWAWFKLRGRGL